MNITQAIIFGAIQGLTEFLPISSSAHLILLPRFFHWEDPGLAFDIALHFGTLLAVGSYFWRDIVDIFAILLNMMGFQSQTVKKRVKSSQYNDKIIFLLVLATIPGAMAGYFLDDFVETVLRSPSLIAFTLIVFGWLLYWSDKISTKKRKVKNLNAKDALLIGTAQALAIIPGTSRSGVTITTGLLLGLTRQAAARFSFLMSIPIILGAVIYKIPKLLEGGITSVEIIGIIASAVSGYLAIAGIMKFINNVSYKIFFWYRLVLAGIIVVFLIW